MNPFRQCGISKCSLVLWVCFKLQIDMLSIPMRLNANLCIYEHFPKLVFGIIWRKKKRIYIYICMDIQNPKCWLNKKGYKSKSIGYDTNHFGFQVDLLGVEPSSDDSFWSADMPTWWDFNVGVKKRLPVVDILWHPIFCPNGLLV